MENCDSMGTRVAAGLISDLANSIQFDIMQWMDPITSCLQHILVDNSFDSEAKLVTIIAFGDVSLAAGPIEFMKYLPGTMECFTQASQLSLTVSNVPDDIQLLTKLRVALVEAYISILHALVPEDNTTPLTEDQEMTSEQFAL